MLVRHAFFEVRPDTEHHVAAFVSIRRVKCPQIVEKQCRAQGVRSGKVHSLFFVFISVSCVNFFFSFFFYLSELISELPSRLLGRTRWRLLIISVMKLVKRMHRSKAMHNKLHFQCKLKECDIYIVCLYYFTSNVTAGMRPYRR